MFWDQDHGGAAWDCYLGASNAALKACGLARRWRNAMDLLSGLSRCGCRASEVTLTAAAGCGGPWRQLLRLAAAPAAAPAARQRAWAQALQLLGPEPEPFAPLGP